MRNDKRTIASRQIKSITYIGIAVNIALAVIKVVIGSFAGSLALVADGVHSLSDVATDAASTTSVLVAPASTASLV